MGGAVAGHSLHFPPRPRCSRGSRMSSRLRLTARSAAPPHHHPTPSRCAALWTTSWCPPPTALCSRATCPTQTATSRAGGAGPGAGAGWLARGTQLQRSKRLSTSALHVFMPRRTPSWRCRLGWGLWRLTVHGGAPDQLSAVRRARPWRSGAAPDTPCATWHGPASTLGGPPGPVPPCRDAWQRMVEPFTSSQVRPPPQGWWQAAGCRPDWHPARVLCCAGQTLSAAARDRRAQPTLSSPCQPQPEGARHAPLPDHSPPHTHTHTHTAALQVWMYCVGNHEIELTNGVKDFLAYETR